MEEKELHVRIVPMTADHLDEVAELERVCFTTPWSRNMLAEELDNDLLRLSGGAGRCRQGGGLRRAAGGAGRGVHHQRGRPAGLPEAGSGRQAAAGVSGLRRGQPSGVSDTGGPSLQLSAAIALYGSRGFRGVGRRKNYYEHPREDAIIMTREFEHHGTENPVS